MTMNSREYVSALVAKAKAAQQTAEGFTQKDVDLLTGAVAYTLSRPENAKMLAEMLVSESGMGIAEDKEAKIYAKVKGTYFQMKDKVSVGLTDSNEETGIQVYAKPMGVIGAIIPVTNGEATPIVKSLMALKTRNAIILAPHPKARQTNLEATRIIRQTIANLGYPADLVQAIEPEYVSVETSQELMSQVDFILATGGTPMVRQAYSSGNPAIGVGTGNVVSIVDGTTNLDETAKMIVKSKTFDHATSCSTENNIIVFEDCYEDWLAAMQRAHAFLIREGTSEKERLLKTLWPNSPADHQLNRHIIAQPATAIAAAARIDIPLDTRLLLVEENGGYGNEFPFTGEKLSPVAGVRKAKDFDDAIEKLMNILEYQGKGHSCGIHTTDDEKVSKLGELIPVCKVCVNQPQSLTNSGSWTCGFPISMTLGCGTWGHNSISHNATFKDLLNYTYVSRPIPSFEPSDEDLFDNIPASLTGNNASLTGEISRR